ncbi:MAG TPA: cysteine desulfurase family protein [Thermoanaerobaculia bacterium]|nr:cysteine desulfurase family protein [Thermoanaerobaculia bacterium]
MIYVDHHSTTPCDPRVLERMLPFFSERFGNSASITHSQGRNAASAVEEARISLARFLGADSSEIYFTAGATESNNIALNLLDPGQHLIVSAIEHKSILEPAKRLESAGVSVTILPVDREGFVAPDALAGAIRPNTRLASVMAANSEIGTIEPIRELASLCRERGVLFHTDATQAAGKIALDLGTIPCDLLSFSAHKVYGPKGIGGLFVRRGVRARPLVVGGGQERGVRSGTVNVPGVVGMAAAFDLRTSEMAEEGQRLTILRNDLWDRLLAAIPGASVNGPRGLRLAGNLNVSFERVEAESLIHAMRRFSLSSGSACSSGEHGPSPVLRAIGVSEALARGSIRIGLGKSNTAEQMTMLAEDLTHSVERIRRITAV